LRAVFLSYASQDAETARRICDALRAIGIEVWFDKSELRCGDAWDRQIRRQIRDCTLFLPIISANSQARHEGYFRLEWDLADQRTHLMGRNRAFIVPVCTDATLEREADVPDSFLAVQWTRLPAGETPPAFAERILRLLSGEMAPLQDRARSPDARGLMRRRTGVLYGAIAAAVGLILGYLGIERLNRPGLSVPSAASIAVLPLANESGDSSQQYFSDGISEDLIIALGQFPGLKVIGRSSAFQFRDSKEGSRSIGTKLGVAYLLEGSVRRSGDMIRVSAALINTADGIMQWSERYDRPYKDLFTLQDEITLTVAEALKTKLLPGEHAAEQSERPPSGNLEAYNALLQGRFYTSRSTEEDFRKAIGFNTQATVLDPRYARAWSALSTTWTDLASGYLEGAPAQLAYAKAREAVDRALTLAPDLAAAHVARCYLLQMADFDWQGAEAACRRALTLAPSDGLAKFNVGNLLASFGQIDQGIELTRQALTTEPLRPNWYSWLAMYLAGVNRLDEAERSIRRSIELQPAAAWYHFVFTMIEVRRGNAQGALAVAQQEPPGLWQDAALALARQVGTDRRAADAALKTLIERDPGSAPYQIAEVYALRNDANAAFEWLDRAWNSRDAGVTDLLYDPFILRYKDDPRFAAFCRKVGLPVPGEAYAVKST
jgi:TolB-like protein/Tfp pilus assembly protein PilF